MQARVAALGLGAVVVFGGALYLMLQVSSEPSVAANTKAARDDRSVRDSPPAPPPTPESGSGGMWSPPGAGSAKQIPGATAKVDMTASKAPGAAGPAVETPAGDDEAPDPNVDLDLAMDEANKLYDGNDYEAAARQAIRVLGKTDLDKKDRTRMLRIVVSSSCMMGDVDQATQYFDELPAKDQGDMVKRCERFQIQLKPAKPKPT
jgi:hypothetical protein